MMNARDLKGLSTLTCVLLGLALVTSVRFPASFTFNQTPGQTSGGFRRIATIDAKCSALPVRDRDLNDNTCLCR
jgi:hypothetical protein